MYQIRINLNEFLSIVNKYKIKEIEVAGNLRECKFEIYAEKIKPGDIFIAIDSSKYPNSDGALGFTNNEDSVYGLGGYIKASEKIEIAISNGASIIVVDSCAYYRERTTATFICVEDCLEVLIDIARCCLAKSSVKIIAITGSTGKTTVTNALCDFLSVKYQVKKIERIRNSVLGIIVQILHNLDVADDFLIVEMQLDGIGQIKRFCEVVQPDYSIITSVNLAHYSRFKSVETIYNEKIQVYKMLKNDGKLIINADDEMLVKKIHWQNDKRVHLVGLENKNSEILINNVGSHNLYHFHEFMVEREGCSYGTFKMNTVGRGTLYGAAFSLFFACEYGFTMEEICRGLLSIKNPIGRFQGFQGVNGSLVIMDSYNANYYSMVSGLDYITNLQYKRKIVVLGSMLELGEKTETEHKRLGEYIEKKCDITNLVTLGEAAMYIANEVKKISPESIFSVYDYDSALKILQTIDIDDETVLYFKGSGAMRMELLIPYFLEKRIF